MDRPRRARHGVACISSPSSHSPFHTNISLTSNLDYAQNLDLDSRQPGALHDHEAGCEGGSRNLVSGGKTLPIAYGETQRVDSCNDELGDGVGDWGETQVIDEFQETEVIRNDDDDVGGQSERTELLTDKEDDFYGEVGSGICAKDGDLVDPNASTDEEQDCGSVDAGDISSLQLTGNSCKSNSECSRKSFVSIRVAALRSSGFTAARSMNCTPIVNKSESSNLDERNFNSYNQDKVEDNHTGLKTSWMEAMPCSVSGLNVVGTKKDEIILDHHAENSFRCIGSCNRDGFLHQEEGTIISEINKVKWETHCPIGHGEAAASYISSQEPGVQSQAIALGIVDKFLSINDLELSQNINNVSTDTVISPPIASVKRVQSCMMKFNKNTAGNAQVYEWNDSLENEEGGELFSRKDYSSFDRKGRKQSFPKLPSEVIFGGSETTVITDNKCSNESVKSRTSQKLARIACFGSKLKHSQAERDVHASKARSKKSLFNDMEVHANTEKMVQSEKINVDAIYDVYDIGPATQMAAEAIQALCHSSPVNYEQTYNLEPKSGDLVGSSTNIKKPRHTPTRKRSKKSQESKGVMTRSKCKINVTKSRTTSCNPSRKQSAKLKTKMVLEESTLKIAAKMTEKELDEESKGVISTNNGDSAVSIVENKMKNRMDKKLQNPSVLVSLYKQPLDDAKSILDTSQMYTSPVAHRTRHSKAAMLLNVNKTSSNYPTEDTNGINLCDHGAMEIDNELVLNSSVASKINKNGCNINLNATYNGDLGFSSLVDAFDMERVHAEEIGESHDKDACRETKRRKNNIDSDNQINDCKMVNHSKSVDVIVPKDVKIPVQRKKRRVFIRSMAEVLDTVKRKRRSAFSNKKLETDYLSSNIGNVEKMSGTRTRSSLLSDILKPYFANASHFKSEISSKPASGGIAYTCSVSSVKHVTHNNNPETSKECQQSRLPEVFYSKPEGSPDVISQPGLACSPTIGINAISPVGVSLDRSTISAHKSLPRSSITRELIRLEAANTSPSKLNDLRRRKDMGTFHVCFSNHLSQDVIKQQKKILARLGVQVVSSSSEASHFVADKFVRTKNMLEAMAMGKPVVTPTWLERCGQASSYIDEKNYILRDAKKEKEIGFSMPVSLARAVQHPLLQGKRLFITQNTKPNQELISSLVKSSGGQVLERIVRSITKEDRVPDDLIIISSEEDFTVCKPLLEKGAAVFSSELLLNGIVIQKLEYGRHQLFLDKKL